MEPEMTGVIELKKGDAEITVHSGTLRQRWCLMSWFRMKSNSSPVKP
jgi:hypothetical protein